MNAPTSPTLYPLAFVGGGNMASAIVGGLIKSGCKPADVTVLDPSAEQRERLAQAFGVRTLAAPGADLAAARTVVWAVKPQQFKDAAAAIGQSSLKQALHFSVMAGIRSADIARAVGSQRVVRSMPNTPALIGRGIAGLYAGASVSPAERNAIAALLAPTGSTLWVEQEADLDAVTALSGSGPAYVYYFIEAMQEAAQRMGLSAAQGRELAAATFAGATALVQASSETPQILRERVTSKGGTTYAALTHLEGQQVKQAFVEAMLKAQARARELGDEFGS